MNNLRESYSVNNHKPCIWRSDHFHPLENPLYFTTCCNRQYYWVAESTSRGVNPTVASIVQTVNSSTLVNRSSSRGTMSNPQPKSKANSEEVSCYVCKQSRPCCRQPLLELRERGTHEKFVRPIQGPPKEAWGVGSVWVICCGSICGMYYNEEITRYDVSGEQ